MAEKPILFNTEMVKAILGGRKTQTRRVIKPVALGMIYEDSSPARKPPYHVGDILWVRETWCKWWLPHGEWRYIYKATSPHGNTAPAMPDSDDEPFTMPWRPSIHMPKEAARLFLLVTSVRIQRLQEITSGEAVAEGIKSNLRNPSEAADALIAFEELWNSTIKPADLPRYGWEANPWVWVIEFERINRR